MSRSAVCATVLLVIAIADFSSAGGLLLAKQTVKLDLTCKTAAITCNNSTITELEKSLVDYLNMERAAGTNCEFLLAGETACVSKSITFCVALSCAGPRADGNLVSHVEQQEAAITKIMEEKSSEQFTSDTVTITCRLFRDSDRRKMPSPTCDEECTEESQSTVTLCDCPFVDVLKPSCNIPAVLVYVTKVTAINATSCDQVNISSYSVSQQLSNLSSPVSYNDLQFHLATDHINTTFHCNNSEVNGLVYLTLLTSVIVNSNTPHCGDNTSCIDQFNDKQLNTIKEFFQFISLLVPQLQSLSVGELLVHGGLPTVDVQLSCDNGTTVISDGACCFPGCDACYDRAPTDIVLAVHFNVSQLSTASCSQIDSTELINSITIQMTIGSRLVYQAGGRLDLCGVPSVSCNDTSGRVGSIGVRVPLLLVLAPEVVVNSEEELINLINDHIKELIIGGQVSVGGGNSVPTESFAVELTTECTFTPECPAGSYLKNDICQLCPIGQYTEEPDQSECLHCPDGETTSREGASSASQCVGKPKPCPKGHYSVTGLTPCLPCDFGKLQASTGQTSCTSCPPGYTTVKTGSTSYFDCTALSTTCLPAIKTFPLETVSESFFTSPNYPKDYTICQNRSYNFHCAASNLSVGLFIFDLSLGSGDSLIVRNNRYDGPMKLTIPLPIMYDDLRSLTITFISDGTSTSRGFRIARGCYLTQYSGIVKNIAFDCKVREYIATTSDDVVRKILKLLRDGTTIAAVRDDKDLTPLYNVFVNGSMPCTN